jgi:hypothetical protein
LKAQNLSVPFPYFSATNRNLSNGQTRRSPVLKAFPGSHRKQADKNGELILNPKYNIKLKA